VSQSCFVEKFKQTWAAPESSVLLLSSNPRPQIRPACQPTLPKRGQFGGLACRLVEAPSEWNVSSLPRRERLCKSSDQLPRSERVPLSEASFMSMIDEDVTGQRCSTTVTLFLIMSCPPCRIDAHALATRSLPLARLSITQGSTRPRWTPPAPVVAGSAGIAGRRGKSLRQRPMRIFCHLLSRGQSSKLLCT
jgi:hypothetical protein